MNNCLCESCCGKDYCLFYQDYKNPDGIVVEPITACGRYKKLHTVEDTYTKDEVVAMLEELKYELYHALCYEIHGKEDCPCDGQTTSCLATFRVCDADRAISRTIQQKITELKE